MAALSDATLLAISRLSVGTPVSRARDFTAMTPAQVAAEFELSSYGGDAGSYVYAPGADGDYDALDPDLPPVNDLGLWACGAFVNLVSNSILSGAVVGVPGTAPSGLNLYDKQSVDSIAPVFGVPSVAYTANGPAGIFFSISGVGPTDAVWAHCICGCQATNGTPQIDLYSSGGGGSDSAVITAQPAAYALSYVSTTAGTISFYPGSSGSLAGSQVLAAGPQLVFGPSLPPVLALSSAATTTKLAAITQREVAVWKPFVVVVRATTKEDPGASQVFYSLSRNADELIEIYRATGTDQITLHIRSGGVDYTDALGSVADNTAFTVAFNVFASFTAASLDGGTVQVLTAPKPSGVLTLESIGCKHDGTLQCNGPIAECTLIHPAVWTAAQLEAA